MATFSIPAFGYSSNNLQGVGSPKTAHSIPMYQPMPAVGTPSFGGLGRSMTPKESSRHSSYSKDIEPTIQTIQPSVERTRRHREYYLEGGDIHFLVRFRAPPRQLTSHSLTSASQVENYLFRVHRYVRSLAIEKCGWRETEANDKTQIFFRPRVARVQKTFCRWRLGRPSPYRGVR